MNKRILAIFLSLILCLAFAPIAFAASSTNTEEMTTALGSESGVSLAANGDVYTWGSGNYGQIGNGTSGSSSQAKPLKVLSNVASLTICDTLVAAIAKNGDLYCWGSSYYGQSGNGQAGEGVVQATPLKVLSDVVSAKAMVCERAGIYRGWAGAVTVMALTKNGDLYAWGANNEGQVGNGQSGTGMNQTTPVRVLSNVSKINMELNTVAALTTNGDLYAWGYNQLGQVGNGKMGEGQIQTTPVKVLANVASLMSSGHANGAITQNGDLYRWGVNYFGQVGNGKMGRDAIQATPVMVLSNVASAGTGGNTSVAITENGDLYCWGSNTYGVVGNGSALDQATPVMVLANVSWAASESYNTRAITKNGDLYCWGENSSHQIANGGFMFETTPVKVKGLSNVASFTTYLNINSLALTTSGDLYSWGENEFGMIGNGTSAKQATPFRVLSNIASVVTNDRVTAAVGKNGDLYSWGNCNAGRVGNGKVGDASNVIIQTSPVKILTKVRVPAAAPVAPKLVATPTASKVLVDGKNVAFDAYNISSNNYFKLRDLAYVLNTSAKKFSVAWDDANNAIALKSGEAYTVVGGEMATKGTATVTPEPTSSRITLNGPMVSLTAYNIKNNNYFKLRDIGLAFDFDVSWDNALQTIVIDTTKSYTED